jgi:hypothetical protein
MRAVGIYLLDVVFKALCIIFWYIIFTPLFDPFHRRRMDVRHVRHSREVAAEHGSASH